MQQSQNNPNNETSKASNSNPRKIRCFTSFEWRPRDLQLSWTSTAAAPSAPRRGKGRWREEVNYGGGGKQRRGRLWLEFEISWIEERRDWVSMEEMMAYQRGLRRWPDWRDAAGGGASTPTASMVGKEKSGSIGWLRGTGVERRERWIQRWLCMRRSLPDGGAAHGGARLRFWVERETRDEREEKEKKK